MLGVVVEVAMRLVVCMSFGRAAKIDLRVAQSGLGAVTRFARELLAPKIVMPAVKGAARVALELTSLALVYS